MRCVSSSAKLRDIVAMKSPIPVEECSSIVYSLSCSCGALYVGRTCRHLVTRINEHQKPGGLANVHQKNCQLQKSEIKFGVLYSRARTMFSLSVAEACIISSRRPKLNSREERSYEFILPLSTFWHWTFDLKMWPWAFDLKMWPWTFDLKMWPWNVSYFGVF